MYIITKLKFAKESIIEIIKVGCSIFNILSVILTQFLMKRHKAPVNFIEVFIAWQDSFICEKRDPI